MALAEVDEDYEDSSDMEDEDELNQRIQKKSSDLPTDQQPNMSDLTRSQTEPHGDISDFDYKHKSNKGKHVEKKKKKKNGKSSSHLSTSKKNGKKDKYKNGSSKTNNDASMLKKAKSMHGGTIAPKRTTSYKQDHIEDVDVQSVESDDAVGDIMSATITEDDVYLDMSITAEEYSNLSKSQHSQKTPEVDEKKNKPKRWTIGNMKESIMGAMSAKKSSGPLSPPVGRNGHNGHKTDSPVSTSVGKGYSPTTPDPDNLSHSLSQHSNGSAGDDHYRKDSNNSRKGSTPHKKGSVSTSLFQGAKGLFGRSGSSKDFTSTIKDDEKEKPDSGSHKKSPSKSGLSSFKSKLKNIKNMGSSTKNIHAKTPTPAEEQNMETRKVEKKKKTSSKKTANGKGSDQLKRKKDKSPSKNDIQPRKRSHSQNKAPSSSITAPPKRGMTMQAKNKPLKRHSMQPEHRSHSQKPKSRQSTNTINSNKTKGSSSANRYRNKTEADIKPGPNTKATRNSSHADIAGKKLKMNKGSKSEFGKGGRDEKKSQYDGYTMQGSKSNGSHRSKKNNLSVDDKGKKSRTKSGSSYEDDKKAAKEAKAKELEKSMLAADKKCKFRIKNEIFELYEYYKPIRLIGSGAYAVVCEAIDERTKKRVAIKKNKHIFDDIRDARRILREIKLLLHFNKFKHPDLIEIYDSLPPTVAEIQDFEDVYIVMPLLESNLCKIITSKQQLSNLHYQYLTYQVLRGLKFIHEAGVIHRDIKPENILLNGSDCDVKIIDFGLARGVLGSEGEDNPENAKATEYVCTRWYRSPEVMCSGGRYDEKMDIWGVGCILAEMILRRPLFPGANYLDQLQQIFDIMGTPNDTEWILNDQARSWVQKLPKHNGKNLKKMIAHKFEDNETDLENCADLLYKLLALNPADRISAADSLQHPYFKEMHDEDEILTGEKFDLSFEFEKSIKTKFGVRHMMYTALDQYHKKTWHKIRKKQKRREQKEREKANGGKKHKHRKHRSSKHKSKDKEHQ